MSQSNADFRNEHLRNIVIVASRAGDHLADRQHIQAMWTLWSLIPRLDVNIRTKYEKYLTKIPDWEKQLKKEQGMNQQQTFQRKHRLLDTLIPEIESLYNNLYSDLVDSGLFQFQSKSRTLEEINQLPHEVI